MIEFHKSCRTISVYDFYKTHLYQDYRYLIKGFDEHNTSTQYDKYLKSKELKLIFEAILEEYSVLMRDKKSLRLRKMEWNLLYLGGQHSLILRVLSIYKDCKIPNVLEILNDLEVKFDINEPIGDQIDNAIIFSKRLKNRINILKLNFKRLSGIDDDKEQSEPEDIMNGLDKTALLLETNLELGYQINIKTTVMERWLNLIDMNRIKSNQRH